MGVGTFTAKLSDNSAAPYTDSSKSSKVGTFNMTYTLQYSAASKGQTLNITWAISQDFGGCSANIDFATLQ